MFFDIKNYTFKETTHNNELPNGLSKRVLHVIFCMLVVGTLFAQVLAHSASAHTEQTAQTTVNQVVANQAVPSEGNLPITPWQAWQARYLLETVLGASLLFLTSDSSTALSIALMATVQLFYYTLWSQPRYQQYRDRLYDYLYRLSQENGFFQQALNRVRNNPDYQRFASSSTSSVTKQVLLFFFNKGMIFSFSVYLLSLIFPSLTVNDFSKTWPDFFKRIFAPEWLSKKCLPFAQQSITYVTHVTTPFFTRTQGLFGSSLHAAAAVTSNWRNRLAGAVSWA